MNPPFDATNPDDDNFGAVFDQAASDAKLDAIAARNEEMLAHLANWDEYIAENTNVPAEDLGLKDDLALDPGEEDIGVGKPGELAFGLADEHDAEFVAGLGPAESPADDEGEISPADEEVLDDMVDDAIENGWKSDKPSGWKPYVHDADDVIQMTALKGKTEAFNEAIRKISWDLPKNATNAELVAELQGWDVEDVYTKTDQVYKYEATFEEKWKDQIEVWDHERALGQAGKNYARPNTFNGAERAALLDAATEIAVQGYELGPDEASILSAHGKDGEAAAEALLRKKPGLWAKIKRTFKQLGEKFARLLNRSPPSGQGEHRDGGFGGAAPGGGA